MHLLFRSVVQTTDPSIRRNTVAHAGMDFVTVMVLLPFDIVVMIASGSIGQLQMIEAVALIYGGQMEFANHLGLVACYRQFTG